MSQDIVYIVIQYNGTNRIDSSKSVVWKVYDIEEKAASMCRRWNELNDGYHYAYEVWMIR